MQKLDKPLYIPHNTPHRSKNLCGPRYLPSLASNLHQNSQTKKSQNRSRQPSISNKNSKLRRYAGIEESNLRITESKSKMNFSLKNKSINKTGRSVFSIYVGIPYLKELRYAKKNDSSLYSSPKKFHSDTVSVARNLKSSNGTLYDKEESFQLKIKKIDKEIKFLESKLDEFVISSQLAAALMGYLDQVDESTIRNVVKIQKWFRLKLHKGNL